MENGKNLMGYSDRDKAQFTRYMTKVVRHARIAYIRKIARFSNREELYGIYPTDHNALQSEYDRVETDLVLFLERLPLIKRKILCLFYYVGLSAEEIGQELGCSTSFVYRHKFMAVDSLRKMMTGGNADE